MRKSNKIFIAYVSYKDEYKIFDSYYFDLNEALSYAIADINTRYKYNSHQYSNIKEFTDTENCKIYIDIISTDRLQFYTKFELQQYFDSNIKGISKDELYDFLLSISDHDTRVYNYNKDLIYSEITMHNTITEKIGYDVYYSIESCNSGEYKFKII